MARYTMTADVYSLKASQDPASGKIIKDWQFDKTIDCYATSIESEKASNTPAGNKFRREYRQHEIIAVKCQEDLSSRARLTNFKTRSGKVIWVESEQLDPEPTIFEVGASVPRLDPFGDIIEYEIQASRVEIQDVS